MNARSVVQFLLVALVVVILGTLAGWFFFLRSQNSSTAALDAARGLNQGTPANSSFGAPLSPEANANTSAPSGEPPQLWQVAKVPAAGIGFASSTTGVVFRYVERATGYVNSADPTSGTVVRITDTLMPKIYEALFVGNNEVIERSLDNTGAITSFWGSFDPAATGTPDQMLSGVFLPTGIATIAVDENSGQLFYLQKTAAGVTGVLQQASSTPVKKNTPAATVVFSSALSDWQPQFLADGRMFLAQSAADSISGYSYQLKNAALVPLLRGLPGLTILPRTNSTALIYSTSSGGTLSLFVQVSASSTVVQLPIQTLADKCVWAPGSAFIAYCAVPQTVPNDFLDQWYRGEVHSSDSIWKIDAGAGEAQEVFTPPQGDSVDVEDPVMDDNGQYLAFINAADGTPWVLRLNQ